MATFWIIAGALAVLVALPLAVALRRGTDDGGHSDLGVYRDQLAEVDRDVARGVLAPADADRVRLEVQRRILAADRGRRASRGLGPVAVPLMALALALLGAVALYLAVGAPGAQDLPYTQRIAAIEAARAARPDQASAERSAADQMPAAPSDPEREDLVTQLRTLMARQPRLEGMRILAQEEAALGNFRAARLAQGRVVEMLGDDAMAEDYALLGDLMVLSAGGYVSPEAEAALRSALRRRPDNPTARYYLGLMYAQQGRPDRAYPIWRDLLAGSAPGDPWVEPILLQIEEVAFLAGDPIRAQDLPQPAAARPAARPPAGPSGADIDMAAELSEAERAEMIGGMVQRLADRLATEGGPPQDWARLVTSLRVLGQEEQAATILAQAREVFADVPGALDVLEAGLAPPRGIGAPPASAPEEP